MIVSAKGILAHKFHATYWAIIGLQFESEEEAQQALPKLKGWKVKENEGRVLVWSGNAEALEEQKKLLASYGADEKKIDSLKSLDHGESFSISIPSDA